MEIEQLAAIIEQDPAISARVLGVANSAYFGQTKPVNTVREAIIRVLGTNLVKSLSVSIALAGVFDPGNCRGFDLAEYWYTALATATLSRMLVLSHSQPHRAEADSVYLCGMLHNIGQLLLAHVHPEPMSQVMDEWSRDPAQDIRSLERKHLHIDFLQAGEWLTRRWHLPEAVVEVIGYFDDDSYQGGYGFHRGVVCGASKWVGSGAMGEEQILTDNPTLESLGIEQQVLNSIAKDFQRCSQDLEVTARALVN